MATEGTPAERDHSSSWPRRLAWPRRPAHPVLAFAIGTGLAVYAWVDGFAVPFSRGAFVGVVIPGAVLALIAVGRPPERIPPPERLDLIGMSYWTICVTAFFEWEASAYKDNSWPWHPSFTDLITPMLGPHLIRSVAILLWMLLGWALVRR
jgi:hypothetical protein